MTLGNRLKECRKAKKKTQVDLARELGLNRSTYAKYETGDNEPDNDTLQKLADYFEVTIDYLLGRTDDPSPPEKQPDPLSSLGISRAHYNYDELDEDEKEFLREEIPRKLEEFRRMKAKFMEKKNSKN